MTRSAKLPPRIVSVTLECGDGVADDVADHWREAGHSARVVRRTVRANGASVVVLVVVVQEKKA